MIKNSLVLLFMVLIVAACSKKMSATKTPPAEVVSGNQIFDMKCGKCHDLKKPADFTATEWIPIMDNMAKKAKLSAEEKEQVVSYVKFYAKAG